jgi:hypothetical protein
MWVRVQEDGEILADRAVALRRHRLGRGADDDPVAVLHRQSEQFIAHGAADDIGLHG